MKTLPKTIKVEIKDSDVVRGVAGNSKNCPIAKAIRRAVGRNHSVSVDGTEIVSVGDNEYSIPKKAQDFVSRYDKGFWMSPKERSAHNKTIKPISFVARQVS